MHHHHPPATLTTSMSTTAGTSQISTTGNANNLNNSTQQRRRKKRPNYGTRTVEVRRGYNGFGFTISGQQPCRLSCIIKNSPADQAGLRAGDFLISVNGLNVSKLAHETVVQLMGNISSIRMQIAENYYSDSSDEENANALLLQQIAGYPGLANTPGHLNLSGVGRAKPRFLHHKTKMHRLRNSPQKKRSDLHHVRRAEAHSVPIKPEQALPLRPLMEDLPLNFLSASCSGLSNTTKPNTNIVSADVANVSAMVRVPSAALEYRAIVGYLGTIEMPKQISHSSKLQTVRSCIRKLRQEKRQPTTVLMTILPDSLKLQAANGNVLATYASARLNYVSSSSESENRFFGLVTSAVHTTPIDEDDDDDDELAAQNEPNDPGMRREASLGTTGHISISNSCHVFVVDTKLCEHQAHLPRANEFRVQCTRDPISNLCLEFPNNSEYVVNLIRSMYTMRILPPATRAASMEDYANNAAAMANGANAVAHSPQPSNHSEISTTTSNSDSGIGFHNDCNNISDRILVVDFPNAPHNFPAANVRPPLARPLGIFNNLVDVPPSHLADDKRLTVRAMPDPKTPTNNHTRRPNLLASFNLIQSPANSLNATRSCDDMLALVERANFHDPDDELLMPHASLDELSLHTATTSTLVDDNAFLHPACIERKASDNCMNVDVKRQKRYSLQVSAFPNVPDKLSPKVFGVTPTKTKPSTATNLRFSLGIPSSVDFVEPYQPKSLPITQDMDTWSSLQNLYMKHDGDYDTAIRTLEATNSEPDLGNRALPANASPFRRAWAQSSLRTTRSDKTTQQPFVAPSQQHKLQQQPQRYIELSPLLQRSASMRASENDVYIKSMGGFIDELKQAQHQQQIATATTATTKSAQIFTKIPQIKTESYEKQQQQLLLQQKQAKLTGPPGVAGWANSFEQMLDEPAGLQTFAEFLKKEFSAENIYFWTACERFRQTELQSERIQQAQAIFAKHLANTASDPVNVDSRARKLTEERLESGELDIFAAAQKQIFNLMKFDSFPRFLRSDLYKSCIEADDKQQPLPYKTEDLEELLKTNFQLAASSKLKKSASNAEDRRRKSLLPWHRKTRSKSRDREADENLKLAPVFAMPLPCPTKLPQLSSSSLKIPSTHNSMSDLHSSRSSLSSFDAQTAENACSLCRVILSDGATTIVQTRQNETVGQLVERLLEKRGLSYQFYDVVANGSTKSIDLQLPSHTIASKEVLIEQRVAFKLDLPDPKVISVKSKPKKQLHEVIRPILQKYNYNMDAVQVLMRDTHTPLDLSLPVTVADGQRLQIVMLPQSIPTPNGNNAIITKSNKSIIPKSVSFPCNVAKQAANIAAIRNGITNSSSNTTCPNTQTPQSTLDEITNKVFNELLQGKVDSQQQQQQQQQSQKPHDLCSLKSDDCASETSSIFDRIRRRDSNIPGLKFKTKKPSISSQHSEDISSNSIASISTTTTATTTTPHLSVAHKNNVNPTTTTIAATTPSTTSSSSTSLLLDLKKPIIAKLKAGVKLQLTERVAETQDELLEGLKRAQLARMEDQRGTEINFELPEFLKNKENLSAAATKLRKARANLSPISKTNPQQQSFSTPTTPITEYPQPAPRLSLTQKSKTSSTSSCSSPMRVDEEPAIPAIPAYTQINSNKHTSLDSSTNSESNNNSSISNGNGSMDDDSINLDNKGPPPLPPKPKVLPIKPSNWGVNTHALATLSSTARLTTLTVTTASKIPIDITRKPTNAITTSMATTPTTRCAYLEEPSSSFV